MSGASAVFNLAALLASDTGHPALARAWCRRQADLLLRGCPLGVDTARLALEPVINLVRLQIRDGDGDRAASSIQALLTAVSHSTDTVVCGVEIPAAIVDDIEGEGARRELRRRLWPILLATTAHALASVGQWQQAHTRLQAQRGIGSRMIDGRQIAVVAHLTRGDIDGASALLADTTPGEPWENVVTACLRAHCHRQTGAAVDVDDLLGRVARLDVRTAELIVVHTRLALSVLDVLDDPHLPRARALIAATAGRVVETGDGYAARDLLAHSDALRGLTRDDAAALAAITAACGLGPTPVPAPALDNVGSALDVAEHVIARGSDVSGRRWETGRGPGARHIGCPPGPE